MIQSGGALVKSPTTLWSGQLSEFSGWPNNVVPYPFSVGTAYGELYRAHLWVRTLVSKRARAVARLPFHAYVRGVDGREDGRDTPYGELVTSPSPVHNPFVFWEWVQSTFDLYGEAFLGKVRDRGGRPTELVPLHPTKIQDRTENGRTRWLFQTQDAREIEIARRDLVHFRTYNPAGGLRGLSPLEALRSTLENESGAQRANSALWRNGGRPSVVLSHPGTLSEGAQRRLSANWAEIHGGVDNWAKAAVLEEGMDAKTIQLSAAELQYIEGRKLNREEVCAVYDVPPPVVHILDRATFSNITEQMRSMYRDTMAPPLRCIEQTIDAELRDGRMGRRNAESDFGEENYAEFLLDEVLAGDFERRVQSYQMGIQGGWLMPSEARDKENLPFVEGSDILYANGALQPLSPIAVEGGMVRTDILPQDVRSVLGRLSRKTSLVEVDPDELTRGLGDPVPVRRAYDAVIDRGDGTVDDLRHLIRFGG